MFKTIFSKLMAILLLIIVVGFSITGTLLYYFLNNYVTSQKIDMLLESREAINNSFNIYIQNYMNPLAHILFEQTLEAYSAYMESYVWIVLENGQIITSKPELPRELVEHYRDENGYVVLPNEDQYMKVMNEWTVVTEIGDFYGFFKNEYIKERYGESWLTVEIPLEYADGTSKTLPKAALYLHTPIPELQELRTKVFRFFLYSVGVGALISIILVYILSSRLTRPLKLINYAAKSIAGGEFGKRLEIDSKDEIGQLAGSFNQMAAALQNLEEMRREFIANVSHELRTPMTSIRGFIEGILDGTIPPQLHNNYLQIVREETNRLNRLVNDLLDLAKMESGEMRLSFRNFDINELIRRVIIKLETLIVKKNIQVEADFEEEISLVNADPDAIERVLYNLFHNAIKFSPEDEKIYVSTSVQKEKVLVSVKDNGPGISREEINVIWDRFYKSDKSRGQDKTGTGLGLAIVKNIISEHGQEIWVESDEGKGARFTFTLARQN